MKLIYKHGNIDPERTRAYKLVCPSCGCEFYAANHDFKWREKSIDGKAGITCPDCNIEIVFKPSNCIIDMHEDPDCMVFQDTEYLGKDYFGKDLYIGDEVVFLGSTNFIKGTLIGGDTDLGIIKYEIKEDWSSEARRFYDQIIKYTDPNSNKGDKKE